MAPIDLLPHKNSWVYLINLTFFVLPMLYLPYELWQYGLLILGLAAFIYCYFWAYRSSRAAMLKPTLCIVALASLMAVLNPGAIAMFVFAGFFIGYANPLRQYQLRLALLLAYLTLLWWLLPYHGPGSWLFSGGLLIVAAISFLGWVEQQNMLKRLSAAQSADEIKQLATTLERERIGRDLHDILGHTLSTVVLKTDLANRLLSRYQQHQDHQTLQQAQQQLAELSQIARDALSQVRQSVSGYKHQGLAQEVSRLLARLRDAGFAALLHGEVPALDQRCETALVLALTELVTNVMRHSKGNSCQLSFKQQGDWLEITLQDNGPEAAYHEGNGIKGLRERLAAIGASLTLQQQAGFCAQIRLNRQTNQPQE